MKARQGPLALITVLVFAGLLGACSTILLPWPRS